MKRTILAVSTLALALSLSSCFPSWDQIKKEVAKDSPKSDEAIKAQALSGRIEGLAFEFAGGYLATDGKSLSLNFYDKAETMPPESSSGYLGVFVTVPAEKGDYPLKFSLGKDARILNVYDAVKNMNHLLIGGHVRIDSIEGSGKEVTAVRGALVAGDGKNYLNGEFTLKPLR
jgi:hypothetical protein